MQKTVINQTDLLSDTVGGFTIKSLAIGVVVTWLNKSRDGYDNVQTADGSIGWALSTNLA
jgi:hypothetical protein